MAGRNGRRATCASKNSCRRAGSLAPIAGARRSAPTSMNAISNHPHSQEIVRFACSSSSWVQGSGLAGIDAVLDGKAHQLSPTCRCLGAANGDGNLTQPTRRFGEPALEAGLAVGVLRLAINGGQFRTGPELQEPEVSRKSGASKLGVGLLERPKPGERTRMFSSAQFCQRATLARGAERPRSAWRCRPGRLSRYRRRPAASRDTAITDIVSI